MGTHSGVAYLPLLRGLSIIIFLAPDQFQRTVRDTLSLLQRNQILTVTDLHLARDTADIDALAADFVLFNPANRQPISIREAS